MSFAMKIALIAAALVIAVRIVLELSGAPASLNNVFGVAWLYLIAPIGFAMEIASRPGASPYKSLLRSVAFFAAMSRIMVLLTYQLAYLLQWQAPRFSITMGGNVGSGVDPWRGLLFIPIRNAVFWTIFATVLGMIIGSPLIWMKRRR